ncbi:MAG: dihydroorotase [Gammaproteobacteria bacterium]|nr:dihydroorotase [Gammaproteobacteria bacterium]
MRLSILGGRVIDPANGIDRITDLHIASGKVLAVGEAPAGFEAGRVIDARGQVVCPGLVDLQARLREPGQENKATIASETRAAARAGITTLVCPPDTDPVTDTPAVVDLIRHRATQAGFARVVSLGALTKNLQGEQLAEMSALKNAGCVGVSNAHHAIASTEVMRRAMEYAANQDMPVFLHAQDPWLAAGGCAHEGMVSVRLGLPGIPEAAETIAVARELHLIEQTGVRAHFCQLSSERAVNMIARAQHDGLPVSADVAAHQLFLTEMDIGFFDSHCHVQPPLRTQRDRDGLREALRRGSISAICSDHQPLDRDAKLAPFPSSEPGISGLETLLVLTLRLVDEGLLSLPQAIACISQGPAGIIGLSAGLGVGERADICIFDPEQYWELGAEGMASQGKNSPFLGWEFKGRVTHTLLAGRLSFSSESL